MTDLGSILGSGSSNALGINDAGQIVGEAQTNTGDYHAFLRSGGSNTDLGTLGGIASHAFGINNAGQVVGRSTLSGDPATAASHAFFYDAGTMIDLGTLGGSFSEAYDINSAGEIVGTSLTAGDASTHGFVYTGGIMRDLNSLVPQNLGITNLTTRIGSPINELGQIAASGTIGGHTRALLLTPTPEPSSVLLLSAGALICLRGRARPKVPSFRS